MAYFDNAATTYPKPQEVYDFMNEFYRKNGGNVGRGNYKISKSAGELVFDTRKELQNLFHAPAKQVIFEPTATIALNIIIQGLIKTGIKNIYISPFEHNAVTRVLYNFEKNNIINATEIYMDKASMLYDFEKIKYQFEERKPDLVIITHVSNVTGIISPVEKIFSLAKKYGALTLADMSQSAGLVDLNVGLNSIDFAVFAGHKTLYGPTGISGFIMNTEIKFPAVLFGGTGYESANPNMPESLPEKFEMGTLNILGIAGLYAALEWIKKININQIFAKETENRKRLIDLLKKYDFIKIIGLSDKAKYTGIVSCLIDNISSDSAGNIFNEAGIAVRTGLQCAPHAHKFLGTFPAGTVRFSVSYFTQDNDFAALEKALDFIEENL